MWRAGGTFCTIGDSLQCTRSECPGETFCTGPQTPGNFAHYVEYKVEIRNQARNPVGFMSVYYKNNNNTIWINLFTLSIYYKQIQKLAAQSSEIIKISYTSKLCVTLLSLAYSNESERDLMKLSFLYFNSAKQWSRSIQWAFLSSYNKGLPHRAKHLKLLELLIDVFHWVICFSAYTFQIIFKISSPQLSRIALMEQFVWLMDRWRVLAGWRSASMECGEQCVRVAGIVMMPELCADNWDTMWTQVRWMWE